MAKTFRSRKAKGKLLEKEIAALYRHHKIDETAVPMPMSGAMIFHKGDIFKRNDHEFVDECKNNEKLNIWASFAQAESQCSGLEKPVLHFRRNLTQPLTVMRTEDWFQLRAELKQLRDQLGI